MKLSFSFIVPVFNRPGELRELLASMAGQEFTLPFEVVIVEDGSTEDAREVAQAYSGLLDLTYFYKPNSGPGDSRNYGMARARGNYFIILDSDCVLPPGYLKMVHNSLTGDYVECFGGPDAAEQSFAPVQKAVNYAMTSWLTTGGIRGKRSGLGRFQPRSFNMGLSKAAFEKVGGFGNIHPGEDPDLTLRLWENGYRTKLIPEAFVYHKRRINWKGFFKQVRKFGMVRPILNKWHPGSARITYWFPTVFFFIGIIALIAAIYGNFALILVYGLYFVLVFLDALRLGRDLLVALLSVFAVIVQFTGYGYGFLKSTLWITFSNRKPQELFPELFFVPKSTV